MFKKIFFCFLLVLPIAYAQSKCQQLRIIKTKTADNLISNSILIDLFERLNYEVETVNADSSQEAYMLLGSDEADIYSSTWIPLDIENLKSYALNGRVKTLNPVLTDAAMGLATNQFGKKAGLERFDQISKFGEALDYTIYVGQSNWMFAQRMQSVIDSNIYGLSNFQIKRLHNFDFNEYLSLAETQQKPVVFFTRTPSFIGHKFAAKYLQDSGHFFENYQTNANAYVSVRYDFPKACEEATKVLTKFNLSAAQQAQILELAEGDKYKLNSAIKDFLQSHSSLFSSWLQAIK